MCYSFFDNEIFHFFVPLKTVSFIPLHLEISILFFPETKRQSCGQESSKGSTLLYPELGMIGNHVKERGLASYLMVLHEPINYRQRRGTLWGNMTTMRSTDFPLIQKDLYTIDEEKV